MSRVIASALDQRIFFARNSAHNSRTDGHEAGTEPGFYTPRTALGYDPFSNQYKKLGPGDTAPGSHRFSHWLKRIGTSLINVHEIVHDHKGIGSMSCSCGSKNRTGNWEALRGRHTVHPGLTQIEQDPAQWRPPSRAADRWCRPHGLTEATYAPMPPTICVTSDGTYLVVQEVAR